MNKGEINIKTIKEYLAGKLDVKAMHQLEKQALNDPFLAEAMDGLLENSDASEDTLSILQERLHNRVETKRKRIAIRLLLAVASVLLVVIGLGIFFEFQIHSQKKITDEIVKNVMPEAVSPKGSSTNIAIVQPKSKPESKVEKKEIHSQNSTTKIACKSELNGNGISNSQTNLFAIQAIKSPARESGKMLQTDSNMFAKANVSSGLKGHVAGLAIENANRNQVLVRKKKPTEEFSTVKIIDAKTGKPIEGAIARYGKNINPVVSDSLGQFMIPDSVKNMDINAIGYVALNEPVQEHEIIPLSASDHSLNDVVVIGYGKSKMRTVTGVTSMVPNIHNAEPVPVIGWDKFEDYVQKIISEKYSVGDSGKVKLGFKVNGDGTLSGFKVLKGLTKERNKQAIEILKNGSKWMINVEGKKAITTYEIGFP